MESLEIADNLLRQCLCGPLGNSEDVEAIPLYSLSLREYVESGQWQFDAKGCLKALAMLHDMVKRMDAREDADDGADDYETMLTGGSREF